MRAAAEFGQAEIENFCRAAIDQKNVGGLDVAMNDAFDVGGFEAVGDLNADLQKFRSGDGLPGDAVLESLALEKFHGDEGTAFEFADVVNGADVRVIEGGSGAGFAAEAFDGLRITGDVVGEKFQGDVAAEAVVFGFVDDAHSAATQFFQDGVVGNGAT